MSQHRIKHVVVLMLENRSFDHMLGYLDQGCLPPLSTRDGVPADPTVVDSEFVPIRWLDGYRDVQVDPGHGYCDVMRQLTGEDRNCDEKTSGWSAPYNPTNDGFVWNFATRKADGNRPEDATAIMGCYTQALLPVLSTLAAEFAVCSRWHCSLPSETWPNRLFAHAGTSFGSVGFDKPIHMERSIFDLLDDAGLGWRVYAGDIPQVLTFGRAFAGWRHRPRHMSHFESDLQKGDVPAYTFIEPRHFDTRMFGKSNSQHPISTLKWLRIGGYVPFGEALLARVYTTLRSNSEIWNHTLFLVTYDEHGGFYDRLPPPEVPASGTIAGNGFRFDLLGPRVPAVVISPYVRSGVVEHAKSFDHTSITRTVRELFGVSAQLSPREDAAETVTSLLDLADARRDDELPSMDQYTRDELLDVEEIEDRPLDDIQRELLVVAGVVDPEFGAELVVTPETTSTSVEAHVVSFVEKHYPSASSAGVS